MIILIYTITVVLKPGKDKDETIGPIFRVLDVDGAAKLSREPNDGVSGEITITLDVMAAQMNL